RGWARGYSCIVESSGSLSRKKDLSDVAEPLETPTEDFFLLTGRELEQTMMREEERILLPASTSHLPVEPYSMFDFSTGSSRDCSGVSRRQFLRIGGLSALGLSLPGFLRPRPA